MIHAPVCPECGLQMPSNAPEGLCPQCLLKDALQAEDETPAKSWGISTTPYPTGFAAPAPEELARHFPQLEVLELLGQGGMGAVYKARQPKLDRLVALKILPPEVGREPAFAERFLREARALARLNHPHIVALHDFGQTDGLFYFLMEYVDGGNLRQRLTAGPLSGPEAAVLLGQLCDALQFAHEEGIIHRDIKPENILLDRRGRVRIADFGLARLRGGTAPFTLTGSHQVMGTPYYMAPEQMDRPQEVDHRADIYSAGVVLYEALTGKLPVGSFTPPSQKAGVDTRFDAIVQRALAREPEQRYQHVGELKKDLDGLTPGGGQPQVIAVAIPLARAGQAAGRRPSIPFRATACGGFATARGIFRLTEKALQVEYVYDWLDMFSSSVHEVSIPLASIDDIRLKKHVFAATLVLTCNSFKVLEKVPGKHMGRLKLSVSRHDRESAEALVAMVRARLGLGAEAGPAPEPTASPEDGGTADAVKSFVRSVCGYFVTGFHSSSHETENADEAPAPGLPAARPRAAGPGFIGRLLRGLLRAILVLVFLASLALFFSVHVEERNHRDQVDLFFVQVRQSQSPDDRSLVEIGYPSPWFRHTEMGGGSSTQIEARSWSWAILAAGICAMIVQRALKPPTSRFAD